MTKNSTILITGATGLLGRAVYETFKKNDNWNVVGTGFSRCKPPMVKLNLFDNNELRHQLKTIQPKIVIHCAAERRPDVAEKDSQAAEKLNVGVVEELSKLSLEFGFWLIYISTDYVFDGTNPPYEVTDKPNPLNFYGRTKFLGEEALRKTNQKATILRVAILYGQVESLDESAVTVLAKAVKNTEKPVEMDHVCIRFPTHVQDIANVLIQLCKFELEGKRELVEGKTFHFSAQEAMTKYQMAIKMAELLGLPTDHLKPQTQPPKDSASRPVNAQLSIQSLKDIGLDLKFTSFKEGIAPLLQ